MVTWSVLFLLTPADFAMQRSSWCKRVRACAPLHLKSLQYRIWVVADEHSRREGCHHSIPGLPIQDLTPSNWLVLQRSVFIACCLVCVVLFDGPSPRAGRYRKPSCLSTDFIAAVASPWSPGRRFPGKRRFRRGANGGIWPRVCRTPWSWK